MSAHDELENELRRLLTADRLDLPTRPDAPSALRQGVAVRRRRRAQGRAAGALLSCALAGFFAVTALPHAGDRNTPANTSTPTAPTSPTTSPSTTPTTTPPTTTGDDSTSRTSSGGAPESGSSTDGLVSHGRYGPLQLGMSVSAARASGWLVDLPATLPMAPARRCAGWYRDKEGRAAVFLSDRGVEAMIFSKDAHTLSNVAIGDPWAKVFTVYRSQGIKGAQDGDVATLALQGKPAAQMRFVREYDDTVGQIVVERLDQDCYG